MSKSERSRFCVAPFVSLNTRGHGNARICCSITGLNRGIPKNKNIAEANIAAGPDLRGFDPSAEYYNLTKDPVEDMWNDKYYVDIRKKMLKNEYIPNCKFCYQLEDSGLWSKRMGRNHIFLGDPQGDFDNVSSDKELHHKTADYIQRVRDNNGVSDTLPKWLEIRFSTECNLRCVMCCPSLSTSIYKEFEENFDELSWRMKGSLRVARELSEPGQLKDSDYFMSQIKKLAESSSFFEFRGGEVLQDKKLLEFIEELSFAPRAKKIYLDLTTNGIGLSHRHIEMFNRFGGGNLKMSIDAYGELNEFIRYPSKWPVTVRGLQKLEGLHENWRKTVQATLTVFQVTSMSKLLYFLDELAKTKIPDLVINMTMVRGNKHLIHSLADIEDRLPEVSRVEKFVEESYMCSKKNVFGEKNSVAVLGLAKALRDPQVKDKESLNVLYEQIRALRRIRGTDALVYCPHLIPLIDEVKLDRQNHFETARGSS